MKTIALGSQGLKVSELGFGCMGLTSFYGEKLPDDDIVDMLKSVAERGVTFWDTANVYTYQEKSESSSEPVFKCQEEIISRAIKEVGRDNIVIATKTGLDIKVSPTLQIIANSTPEFIREQCEASLKRLDIETIDLFYLHRIDQQVPIEKSMKEMKRLVEENKVKYVGLSECSASTLRRAHKVHPITAVQLEYSLWCRGVEGELFSTCKELGIGVVAYSPLGRGFLSGEKRKYDEGDFRNSQERMKGEAGDRNAKMLEQVRGIAEDKNISMPQLALAWIFAQQHRVDGCGIVPIPGTTKLRNLDSNVAAVDVQLSEDDLKKLENAIPHEEVIGSRYQDDGCALWETDKNPRLTVDEAKELGIES